MLQFLADENLNGRIVRGLRRHSFAPTIHIAQELDLTGTEDPELLKYAAQNNLVVDTHDINTMAGFAYDRVRQRLAMPGVIEVRRNSALARVIEELALIAFASQPSELEGKVIYVPM